MAVAVLVLFLPRLVSSIARALLKSVTNSVYQKEQVVKIKLYACVACCGPLLV